MTSEVNYDELLYPILVNEENIIGFFDKVFDFLYRRTDYFKIKKNGLSKIGLQMGEAENIVRSVFCKYMELAVQQKSEMQNDIEVVPPDYVAEEVVTTTEHEDVQMISEQVSNEHSIAVNMCSTDKPNQQSEPEIPWMDPDCYNGARYDDYCWAQSLKDVDIRIKVPRRVTTGKHVKVEIKRDSISTEVFFDGNWHTLKKEDLTWHINVEDSTWTLVPGEHIHICLQKLQQRWWDASFIGEPKINLRAIDPTIPFEDLDEESQAKINELVYNEQQKCLGKPTIQQSAIQNVLKEAWNAKGSPFEGQPYDPSLVDVTNTDFL